MKQLSTTILLISLLHITALCQEDGHAANTKNMALKFAPAGLAAGKITLGGEYNFKHKNAVTLLVGFPFKKSINIEYDGKNSDINSEAFSLMAGYRYYLGKKAMNGFYIEPYVKYLKHKSSGLLDAELNGDKVVFDSRTDYEGYGAGAQLGIQFLIAKLVTLDLFLLGPEANAARFSSTAEDITDLLPWTLADEREVEQDIKDILQDIPVVGDKVDVQVDALRKIVSTRFSGFAPGFRAGASIGIRF